MVCPSSGSNTSITLTAEVSSSEGLYVVTNKPTITLAITPTPTANITLSSYTASIEKGGCSDTRTISITSLPDSDVSVNFDSSTIVASNLYISMSSTSN